MSRESTFNREHFVATWLKAYKKQQTQTWVARQLNISRQAVQQRGGYLKSIGIDLPSLRQQTAEVEKKKLNRMIRDALREKGKA